MNKMNKIVGVLFLAIILVVSIVIAAPQDSEKTRAAKPVSAETKNMTYGKCVSDGADLKNNCYKTTKDAFSACKTTAQNTTDSKNGLKACGQTYKKNQTQCKSNFKGAKTECKKIKHNFFESMGSAFK